MFCEEIVTPQSVLYIMNKKYYTHAGKTWIHKEKVLMKKVKYSIFIFYPKNLTSMYIKVKSKINTLKVT